MGSSEASTRRRVKLYMLNDERQWDDKGTGHVSAVCTEQDNMALVVISETDGSYLLESKIQPDTAYQKQQETLIVWSEGDMDLALSFQEKVGCDDVWEKICTVQGKDPSVEITQEVVDESDDAEDTDGYTQVIVQNVQPLTLPPCEFAHLEEIADAISQAVLTQQKKDRLVTFLESTNYLNQLMELFHKAEDIEKLEHLHHLYEIIRQLILINKSTFYETLFADEMLMDVIGILEYNPSGRTRHRDFLRNTATFREVIPLHNSELVSKIHQTYRVQYIQECCLPPPCLFDEHTLSQLKTFVSLNKLDIIRALQDDDEFMRRLFAHLKCPDTDSAQRKELSLFVKEFCNISMQTDQKENFLNCLFQHGALRTAEVLLAIDDRDIKSAALEILQAFIENQPTVVRNYVYRETAPYRRDEELLINLMIIQLLADSDPAALRLLRRVIHMKEEFYNRYVIKNNLFKPVVTLFVTNGHRYNLVDSAVIELFDYIRSEEINSLISHIIENFWDILKNVSYVQTFNDLKQIYDHTHRPVRTNLVGSVGQQPALDVLSLVNVATSRFQRDPRALEMEEEQWFDQDEEDEDEDEENRLFSPTQSSPSLILNGSSGSSGSTIAGPISEGLLGLTRSLANTSTPTQPTNAAVSTSELLALSSLTGGGSNTAFSSPLTVNPAPLTTSGSISCSPDTESHDSHFAPNNNDSPPSSVAATAASVVNLLKTVGVGAGGISQTEEGLNAVTGHRSLSLSDRIRARHTAATTTSTDNDSDPESLTSTRPNVLLRQNTPIAIRIKSTFPGSTIGGSEDGDSSPTMDGEADDIYSSGLRPGMPTTCAIRQEVETNNDAQGSESSPSTTVSPQLIDCSPSVKRPHDSEVGFANDDVDDGEVEEEEEIEDGVKPVKRFRKTVHMSSHVPSVDSLFSDDLNGNSELPITSGTTTTPIDTSQTSSIAQTSDDDNGVSAVGLVDYSDEESDDDGQKDNEPTVSTITTTDSTSLCTSTAITTNLSDGVDVSSSHSSAETV